MNMSEVYSKEEHRINFSKRKVTDIPTVRRVMVPPDMKEELEVEAQTLKNKCLMVVTNYKETACDSKGRIKEKNLTEQEIRGLKECLEMKKKNEAVFFPTDKLGRFAANTLGNYILPMETT